MELHNILAFMAVASLLVMSPGPNGLLIAKTVPVSGKKAGFANVWGFVAAFYVHGSMAVFGLSLLLVQSAKGFLVFKLCGAAYLMWIGCKALNSAIRPKPEMAPNTDAVSAKPASLPAAFAEGFVTNALNPKVSIFYLAAFPQFMPADGSVLSAFALVTAHSVVNVLWFSVMVLLLARVKRVSGNAGFKRWLNGVTGTVFIGFGAKLALMKEAH